MSFKTRPDLKPEQYKQLNLIRNQELTNVKNSIFLQWVNHYQEHLDELYLIYCKYQPIHYNDFLILAYECTSSMYDYKTKSYKKYLI